MNIRTTAAPPTDGRALTFARPDEAGLAAGGAAAPSVIALLNALMRAGPDGMDAALGNVLAALAACAGADRTCIRCDLDGRQSVWHWAAQGLDPLPCLPDAMFAEWEPDLRAGCPVLLPDLAALPAGAAVRAGAGFAGVRSILLLPLTAGAALSGLVTLAARQGLQATPDTVALLQSAIGVVETLLARRAAEDRHRTTAQRPEAAPDLPPDRRGAGANSAADFLSPVPCGPDGAPVARAGVAIDMSERKRLEDEIRSSRAYLSEVMDTSIAALAVMDDGGRILYVNLEAERILGLSRAELRGRVYNDPSWRIERLEGGPLPDEDLPYRRAIACGSARDVRFAIHWPDGTRRGLSANAVPLTLPDGAVQVVVSFSDISDQLAATQRLEEARAKAEEMSRAKSVFLANMSHEIRTPLNGVLGMAEVLDTLIDAPEQKQMVATIRRSGETLLTVLNSILDMSKIEAGKMVLEEVPLVPAEILSQVEALHLVQAEEKGLEFEVLASAGADRPRLGDPHRITQILNNLLSNAIKFTESGSVTLKFSCRAGRPVVIEVSDTGVGMTEVQAARVFESFEQADGSMTRRFGGTGLGLSIVRELVGLMGGSVEVQSRLGEGTRLRVTLPLPESDARPAAIADRDDLPDTTLLKGRHVLIADDNVTNRIVLSEMLAQTGVRMALVENGQDAVIAWDRAMTAGDPFDLLLLDITMPVLDGLRALVEIRQREGTAGSVAVPAIAVTANAMPNQVADYIIGGFDTHLAKPFKRKDLLHAIRTLLK